MKTMLLAAAGALALTACTQQGPTTANDTNAASAQLPSEQETEAIISKGEEEWAALATRKDPSVLEPILADDYRGVTSSGRILDKQGEIRDESEQPDKYSAAAAPAMNYRHFGDTVLAQGEQTLTPIGGGAPVRIMWTDVWMYRDGKWQVVGSQNAVVAPKG